jgi:hypothetical protein
MQLVFVDFDARILQPYDSTRRCTCMDVYGFMHADHVHGAWYMYQKILSNYQYVYTASLRRRPRARVRPVRTQPRP